MAEFPTLPLWTDAYISDTAHLTNEEHGVYLRLLMFAWRSPACCLPDDDKRLAIMIGVTDKKWRALRQVISAFWTIQNGTWTQKRLTRERDFVRGKSEKSRDAANARWNANALENNDSGDAGAYVEHMPGRCQGDAPIPTPIKEDRDKSLSRSNEDFERFWAEVPRRVARRAAEKAFRAALKRTDAETLIAGIKRYAASRRGKDPAYTVHPATWLNADRWADEAISPIQAAPANEPRKGDERITPDGRRQVYIGDGVGWARVNE